MWTQAAVDELAGLSARERNQAKRAAKAAAKAGLPVAPAAPRAQAGAGASAAGAEASGAEAEAEAEALDDEAAAVEGGGWPFQAFADDQLQVN